MSVEIAVEFVEREEGFSPLVRRILEAQPLNSLVPLVVVVDVSRGEKEDE